MAKNTEKDKRMAKMLKDNGITRTTGRCPLCYRIISNGGNHIFACRGSKN